jgi:5-methylcytosine-specific restriction enzyme A
VKSFLITFKPSTESRERGWSLQKLQKLVRRHRAGERVEEEWRFLNYKEVSLGDRVFLLLQGKGGPAIIGYGRVAGKAEKDRKGTWRVRIRFESIEDPATKVLANRDKLIAMRDGATAWRTQFSGKQLKESLASELEGLVVGSSPQPKSGDSARNPDWERDELILALNVYLEHRPNLPRKESREIQKLSVVLNRLGEKLFAPDDRSVTFRNENSVHMKLMNFLRLDPQYTADGKTGLSRGAKAEEAVWTEFGGDVLHCRRVAQAIIASLDDSESAALWFGPAFDDGLQEAAEGRLLTRKHLVRERNRKLVETKRKQAIKKHGKLICEVCGFDFAVRYGNRGDGFIECHHTKPVETLVEGNKTHIDDLALVCANCHRMIHRGRPWISVEELRALLTLHS